jgi:hypothetical protein
VTVVKRQLIPCARVDSNHHGPYGPQGPQPDKGGVDGFGGVQIVHFAGFSGRIGRVWRGGSSQNVLTERPTARAVRGVLRAAVAENRPVLIVRSRRCPLSTLRQPIPTGARSCSTPALACIWLAAALATRSRRHDHGRNRAARLPLARSHGAQGAVLSSAHRAFPMATSRRRLWPRSRMGCDRCGAGQRSQGIGR